jgi:signal transduction histidine kinase
MGFGLSGMQERVHALGGEFSIEGVPQRGTSVRVVIPVEVQAARVE